MFDSDHVYDRLAHPRDESTPLNHAVLILDDRRLPNRSRCVHLSEMGTVRIRTLEDMRKWQAYVLVQCRKCGKEARFNAGDVVKWFHACRWSTALDVAPQRFRCSVCGAKDATIRAKMPVPRLPEAKPLPILPANQPAPAGIDPEAWACADHRDRRRLLKNVR